MNKNDEPRYFWISSLFVIGLLLVSTGCVRYRFDARQDMIRASGSRVWAVSVTKDGMGQKIHSFTRLNGARKLEERPSVIISSGKSGNWSWEVRMTPSLLASWYAWQANPRVISRTREKNTWAQPAATWDEAFERALKVSEYLMGKPSLPLKATLLLVPEGTKYKRTVIENAERYTPLTFAFYYPIADTRNSTLDSARFSAMAFAVATMMHEYQHALYGTGFSPAVGNSKVERTINDESRSECWLDSTLLSLTVGTHSSSLLSNEKHGRGSAVVDRVSGKGNH